VIGRAARSPRAARTPAGLVALALASFALGLAEFVIAGLLPSVSRDLSVSGGTAGLLVTTYTIGVIVGALVVTTALSRIRPKTALIGLVAVFAGANLLCALGPDFGIVLIARVIAGTAHGAYFGIGVVVAVSLVEESRQGRAIAVMLTGLTLANVLGVLIHIRNMETVTLAGATVLPPVPAFYHQPETIDDLLNQTAGKILDQFAIEHTLFRRWDGTSPALDHKAAVRV
jgi:MFS family permease